MMYNYTITKILPDFLNTLKDNSKALYEPAIRQFLSIHPDITKVSLLDCQNYIDTLLEKGELKRSTILKIKKELSSFFTFVEKNAELYTRIPSSFTNYFMMVSMAAEPEIIHANKVISLSELDKLTHYLLQHDHLCLYALMFSFKCMLRSSEFIALTYTDIIDNGEQYLLRIKHNGTERFIVLPDDIYCIISKDIVNNRTFLFERSEQQGKPLTIRALNYRLHKAEDMVHIAPYSFNDLRNSGIAYATSQGCDIELLSESLDIRHPSHITRLTSLTNLKFTDASRYTNVNFVGTKKDN